MQSGELGLDAFLPHSNKRAHFNEASPVADERDPFLPLASSWKNVDFRMANVLAPWARTSGPAVNASREGSAEVHQHRAEVNVREWVMRAMARYRFVIGEY